MKKLFKKLALMVVALLTFSVGSNYTVKEVKAEGTGSYVKVTEAPTDWSGRYLFAAIKNNVTYVFNLEDAANGYYGIESSDSSISSTDVSSYEITIEQYSTGYSLKTSKGYMYGTSGSNKLNFDASSAQVNTLTFFDSDDTVKIVSNTSVFTFNSAANNLRYRYYKSTTAKDDSTTYLRPSLFKFVENSSGGETTDPEEPEVKDPTITISGNAYIDLGNKLELTATTTDFDGTVNWSSSNTNVATVSTDGIVTPVAMGETTITAAADTAEASLLVKVYPKAKSELLISEALEICEFTGTTKTPYDYITTGTIYSIDTEYSSTYGNITVTITDGTNYITAYRMTGGADLSLGKEISVTGKLVNYYDSTNAIYVPEFTAGCTYEIVLDDTATKVAESLNEINPFMSLAYQYKETKEVYENATDVLTRDTTGITGTSYAEWSGKTSTSGAVYAGQSAGGNESIQLRSNNNNSGIVTTASGGIAKKITVVWNNNTTENRTLNIYGSNSAYSSPTELYNSETQGTLLGTIVFGTSTELEIDGKYNYIGFRSNSGAMYLTSISIDWDFESEKVIKTMSDSSFLLKCCVDSSISDIKNVEDLGIMVSSGSNTVYYSSNSKYCSTENGLLYVIINLGDIINNVTRLTTVFTVKAYGVYDGITIESKNTKTYSVVGMVDYYYNEYGSEEVKLQVEHLYNYFVEQKLIVEEAI